MLCFIFAKCCQDFLLSYLYAESQYLTLEKLTFYHLIFITMKKKQTKNLFDFLPLMKSTAGPHFQPPRLPVLPEERNHIIHIHTLDCLRPRGFCATTAWCFVSMPHTDWLRYRSSKFLRRRFILYLAMASLHKLTQDVFNTLISQTFYDKF